MGFGEARVAGESYLGACNIGIYGWGVWVRVRELRLFAGCLGRAPVFVWDSEVREGFNFYVSAVFW